MNIAAYCRVSTDKADQLNSLETQKRFFVEYAEKNRHSLIRLYADEGLSGTKVRRRREFQQMMTDAERGLFQLVVVKDISRLARNTVDLLQSVRRLKALGIETVFLTANMTAMGDSEFILTVFGALAQEESASLSKRVKFGKRMNAERGRVPNLVYGYDKAEGDCFSLSVNSEEAAVVRRIYDWYTQDGTGAGRIAGLLNGQGLKTKRGFAWNQSAVRRILINPLYTGKVINGKQEVSDFLTSARANRDRADWLIADRPELRIIGDDQFRQAAGLMRSRHQALAENGTRHSAQHLFSTLIRCRECGRSFRRMVRTYQNTYVRWVCSRHNGQGPEACANAAAVDEAELCAQLDEYFLSLLSDRHHAEQILRRELSRAGRELCDPSRSKTLRARLARLEKQRQRYLELYADDLLTRRELEERLSSGREEQARLEEELRREAAPDEGAPSRAADEILRNFAAFVSVRNLSNAQLKQLIAKIEVDKDGTVDVYLRILSGWLRALTKARTDRYKADNSGPSPPPARRGCPVPGWCPAPVQGWPWRCGRWKAGGQ